MTTRYSVIQYVPDPIAGERINIGIVAVGSDGIISRFVPSWERVRSFAAGRSIDFLPEFVRQFEEAEVEQLALGQALSPVESLTAERLAQISARWRNSIQFTAPATSTRPAREALEMLAPRFLSESPRAAQLLSRRRAGRLEARHLALHAVQLAAELRGDQTVRVQGRARVVGKLEEHRFDAIAQNGAPLLAVHGLALGRAPRAEIRSAIDALAFAMLDVRSAYPAIALGVLAVADNSDEADENLERATRVFQGIGATVLDPLIVRGWAVERISSYVESGYQPPLPPPQLALPEPT